MPGRPRKKRIKAIGEGGSSTRVSKVVDQTPKPKGVVGRPGDKQSVDTLKDVDVFHRGPVRDEGVGRGVVSGSRGGSSVSGVASGSTGKGAGVVLVVTTGNFRNFK
ncbi:hypothetical protein Tco_1241869 [Tanacetum coccineum]